MATLNQLVRFAKEYQISQSEMSFHGEHGVVYICIPEGLVPIPYDLSDEDEEYFQDNFGISNIEYDRWGFYT